MKISGQADDVSDLVLAARAGDVAAYGKLVQATQAMSMAVALDVLREPAGAEDAVQEAYLRAYRGLRDLEDAAAFRGWLRRVIESQAPQSAPSSAPQQPLASDRAGSRRALDLTEAPARYNSRLQCNEHGELTDDDHRWMSLPSDAVRCSRERDCTRVYWCRDCQYLATGSATVNLVFSSAAIVTSRI